MRQIYSDSVLGFTLWLTMSMIVPNEEDFNNGRETEEFFQTAFQILIAFRLYPIVTHLLIEVSFLESSDRTSSAFRSRYLTYMRGAWFLWHSY